MEVVFQNGKKNICLITWTILKIQLDNNLYGLSYCLKWITIYSCKGFEIYQEKKIFVI